MLIESGNNQLAHNLLKLIAKNGPMRPVDLRDALGIVSREYKLTRKGKEAAQW